MDLLSWAIFALAASGALAVVLHLYRRREAPGHGHMLLATLRWLALTLLILLLFDPHVPVPGFASSGERTRVLVDASLSMALPRAPGDTTSRWSAAVREAQRTGGDEVLLFGDVARTVPKDSLASMEPFATSSRLLPALQAASEAGARRVIVLTDGGIEDAAELRRVLPGLGLDVRIRRLTDGPFENRAVVEVEAPAWSEAGKPLRVRAGVAALGAAGDSVTVEVRQGERAVASTRVALPDSGRVADAVLEFVPEPPEGGGLVRYDVAIAEGDAAPDDDVRSVYVQIGERPAGVALVSLRPDWEPRFLLPVLEQSLGLPVRGFLRVTDGRYIELGAGENAGRRADEATVRRIVDGADLVVLHGMDGDAPAWALEAAREARRVLVFPAADARDAVMPFSLPPAIPGEWYPTSDLPASPVASLLAAMPTVSLPPLTGVRPIVGVDGAWSPLTVSRGGRGSGAPVVVAGQEGRRRWAVATAEGFWRWAFRGGEARQAYRRLWGAIGGWLIEEDVAPGDSAVRPVRIVAQRGEPIGWVAGVADADSVAIRITDPAGAVVTDTVVSELRGDTAYTAPLEPGHYTYAARAFVGGEEAAAAEGPFTVDRFSPEFLRAAAEIEPSAGASAAGVSESAVRNIVRDGEPLHTLPWVYIMVVGLVCTEWVLRRRWGLR